MDARGATGRWTGSVIARACKSFVTGLPVEAADALVVDAVKMICLGCNKDLCSQRSKYKSYGALRGCNLGVRDCLQVYCGK